MKYVSKIKLLGSLDWLLNTLIYNNMLMLMLMLWLGDVAIGVTTGQVTPRISGIEIADI